jgi:hypothetical protein
VNGKLRLILDHAGALALDALCVFIALAVAHLRIRFRSEAKEILTVQTITTKENDMEKLLVDGSELDVKLVIGEGKIGLASMYAGKGGGATVAMHVSSDYFFDKLAEKIPGQIDDAVIQVLKAAARMI